MGLDGHLGFFHVPLGNGIHNGAMFQKHFVKTARVRHAPFTDACDLLPKGADDVHAAFIAAGLIDDIMENRIHFNDFCIVKTAHTRPCGNEIFIHFLDFRILDALCRKPCRQGFKGRTNLIDFIDVTD